MTGLHFAEAHSQHDYQGYSSTKWHASAGGADAGSKTKWSTPTARNLVGSHDDTDHEWHARTMRYGEGWAHDPTWNQQKRAKPTHTDPEDDMKVDPMMPASTSKLGPRRQIDSSGHDNLKVEVLAGE